jgi:hypothetical protein
MELVNNLVQVVPVESGVLGCVATVDAKSFKLLKNLVDPLVGSHAVIDQLVDRPDHRIVHTSADRVGGETRFVTGLFFDDVRRNAYRCGAGRHALDHHCIGTNARAVADSNGSENFRAGAKHYAVAESRMALAFVPRRAAECDAVIKRAVVADFGGLAYHHAHAMVDEEAPSDARARMDLDAGEKTPDMRNQTRQPSEARAPQPVREPVHQQRMEPRVTGDHFPSIASCRVALEYDCYLFFESGEHD